MRILQVVHDFLPDYVAGTEVYTYSLSKELSKRHKVHLFFNARDAKGKEFVKEGSYDGLPFTSVNSPGDLIFGYKNKKVDKVFRGVIEEFRPDVIHFQHLLWLSTGLVSIAHKRKIPTVFTLNDFWLLCPRLKLIDTDSNLCFKIKRFKCSRCMWRYRLFGLKGIKISEPKTYLNLPKNVIKTIFNRQTRLKIMLHILYLRPRAARTIFQEVDLFIAPSNFLRDKYIEQGLTENKIIYSDYGMDKSLFSNLEKTSSQEVRFGFIGAIMPQKGIHILLEAFSNIKDATLKIYGRRDADIGYYQGLRKDLRNVEFMGEARTEEERRKMFSNIDILVFPSIWFENSPLVIHEAFMAKLPVITSNLGGMAELVKHNKNGLLFEAGNSNDLHEKIRMVIDNSGLIEKLRENIGPVKTIEEDSRNLEKIYQNLKQKKILTH